MKRLPSVLLLSAAILCSVRESPAADLKARSESTSSYIAPLAVGLFRFWQPDGVVRELDVTGPASLGGAFGWKGKLDGDRITLRSGSDVSPEWRGIFTFEKGRLVSFSGRGGVRTFDWAGAAPAETPLAMWPEASEDTRDFWRDFSPWRKSTRLKLWMHNPNRVGTLFAEIGVILIALLAFLRRRGRERGTRCGAGIRISQWLCVLGLAACAVLMYQSGSRGAFFAFFAAVAAWSVYQVSRFGVRGRRIAFGACLVLLLGVWLFVLFSNSNLWSRRAVSDTLRLDILRAVPQMMCDAPDGWGFVGAGKAYRDWYQRQDDGWLTYSLVSDHLTTLVNAGWPRRFAYLFVWLAVLSFLARAARTSEAARLTLALGLVMGVSSAFNRIYLDAHSLWILPVAALLWTCRRIPRKLPDRRTWILLGVSAAVAGASLGICPFLADASIFDVRVRADGRRILLQSPHPSVWVVDDGCVLGGGVAGKELHAAYAANRALPGLGIVSAVSDLPSSGVRRLVLAGKAGYDFLIALSEGTFPADFQVPSEIVFLSPPFPPSVVPELLLKNAQVRLIIGEFAALYSAEYRKPPSWVAVVPGCELYVPDWIGRCLAMQR